MVSAIRPEAPRIKYTNHSGLGTRGNKQRLTKDVTLLPHLEDLLQGLRMPGPLLGKGMLVAHRICLLMAHYWCATGITPLELNSNGAPHVRH